MAPKFCQSPGLPVPYNLLLTQSVGLYLIRSKTALPVFRQCEINTPTFLILGYREAEVQKFHNGKKRKVPFWLASIYNPTDSVSPRRFTGQVVRSGVAPVLGVLPSCRAKDAQQGVLEKRKMKSLPTTKPLLAHFVIRFFSAKCTSNLLSVDLELNVL